jgi:hypothetical protein
MPVVVHPVARQVLTRDDIRGLFRDYFGKLPDTGVRNDLLANGPVFSDNDLDRAIRVTVSRYNAIRPINITAVAESINVYVLLMGVGALLALSEATRQASQNAQGQDGDVQNVQLDAQSPLYMQISQMMAGEFKEMAAGIKAQLNAQRAYGAIGSEYSRGWRYINGCFVI